MNDVSKFRRNKYNENINKTNELSLSQINQRLKNVNLTKRLLSYEKYINAVPKNERINSLKDTWHPETPRFNKNLSLSLWNKEIKKWRQQIHAWGNLDEEVFKYICSLSKEEKNKYLSNLKLPLYNKKEIKYLKKQNEEVSNIFLKNILLLSDEKYINILMKENKYEKTKNYINEVKDKNDIDNYNNDENDKYKNNFNNKKTIYENVDKIKVEINKPLLFLPKCYNGDIINNEFIIIKQNILESLLMSLKDEYKRNYKFLFDNFSKLYINMEDYNINEKNKEKRNNDIIIYLMQNQKNNEKKNNCNYDVLNVDKNYSNHYFKHQKIKASKYLYYFNSNDNNKKNKKKRF